MLKRMFWLSAWMLLLLPALWSQPGRVYRSLAEVEDPADVYILQLHGKRLSRIPSQVYQMTNLRQLDLRGNRISRLSDSVALLTHLQRVELSRNPLMALPEAMARLDSLAELVLWSTYVTDLPPQFARLDGTLRLLDLRHCPLSEEEKEALEQMLPMTEKLWDYGCNCGY